MLFDVSGNELLQQKQMDVLVGCWNSSHKVTARYLAPAFVGHATGENMQGKLPNVLEPLPLGKFQWMVQMLTSSSLAPYKRIPESSTVH